MKKLVLALLLVLASCASNAQSNDSISVLLKKNRRLEMGLETANQQIININQRLRNHVLWNAGAVCYSCIGYFFMTKKADTIADNKKYNNIGYAFFCISAACIACSYISFCGKDLYLSDDGLIIKLP